MKPRGIAERDTNRIGNISEIYIIGRFLQNGYIVFIPSGGNGRIDLIIEDAEGQFWRIQCKSASLTNDGTALRFRTANHNVTGKHRQMRHYREDCDFFAVYNARINKVYLVPVGEVGMTQAHLQLVHPKHKNQHGYKMAANYEL